VQKNQPLTNADFANKSWAEIHAMANGQGL
jgi:hypothetical protein